MDAIFIVKKMQEKYQKKDKKLYMCFVDMKKAFDRVPRKVMEWAVRKKGLSEVMVLAVMSLYNGAKTRVRVGSAYSQNLIECRPSRAKTGLAGRENGIRFQKEE